MPDWSVYVLRCADGSLYTGIATDVKRRIGEHELGRRGAKYLRGRGPLELVYERTIGDRSVATRIEQSIKRLSKSQKEDLRNLRSWVDAHLEEIRNSSQ